MHSFRLAVLVGVALFSFVGCSGSQQAVVADEGGVEVEDTGPEGPTFNVPGAFDFMFQEWQAWDFTVTRSIQIADEDDPQAEVYSINCRVARVAWFEESVGSEVVCDGDERGMIAGYYGANRWGLWRLEIMPDRGEDVVNRRAGDGERIISGSPEVSSRFTESDDGSGSDRTLLYEDLEGWCLSSSTWGRTETASRYCLHPSRGVTLAEWSSSGQTSEQWVCRQDGL